MSNKRYTSVECWLTHLSIFIQHVKKSGHRGFGFVTFADYGVADCVSRRSHEICGRQVLQFGFSVTMHYNLT